MEIYKIKNLSFRYPGKENDVLKNIDLTVKQGEFITICGESGCGKTTLLRLLKPNISPSGKILGEILYNQRNINLIDEKTQAAEIGFVLQDPDNQIVTDKVWHELAFGMESLGVKTGEIRTRVSEMASFFGIHNWFNEKTSNLSGGQKQLLNLASVMVMQPEVLILDEPTSQLDPVAASEFLKNLKKLNEEFGTTIIIAEHRMEEVFSLSDRVIVMENGGIIADDLPRNIGRMLKNHRMYEALPAPVRIFSVLDENGECPLSVREGKEKLIEYAKTHKIDAESVPTDTERADGVAAVEVRGAYFRYDRDLPDVIKGLNLTVQKGEIFSILGGNAVGKSTLISLVSGTNALQRGKILINGTEIADIPNLYKGVLGVLPQNPQCLFAHKTVHLDLYDMTDKTLSKEEREEAVTKVSSLCKITNLLSCHPYDVSGGEQQRVALAMLLLKKPQILILDEPTKGMDAHFKRVFAGILHSLKESGVTILMVSHDVEFCAEFSDVCALMFDGEITSTDSCRKFFSGNTFYTTATNRMARKLLPRAMLADDVILACGKEVRKTSEKESYTYNSEVTVEVQIKKQKHSKKRIFAGLFLLLCVAALYNVLKTSVTAYTTPAYLCQAGIIICAALGIGFLLAPKEKSHPKKESSTKNTALSKRTLIASLMILIAIPLTIYFGVFHLGDRKYYFISLLIILEILIPFLIMFEKRTPKAREIVLISVLCAIAVAGRIAFFMVPEFKPVVAIIIISGICFGAETGFLVGAVTGFVSNFFFGHGPWTPWQMFAFGIVGFISGILFDKEFVAKTKTAFTVYGFIATIAVYGVIMNFASVLMMTTEPTTDLVKTTFIMGIPIDLIHALSTAFFLWFISEPMIEKLERTKIKYGLDNKTE